MKDWFEQAHAEGRHILVTCSGADYSCCGRGFIRKEGYEQTYRGFIVTMGADSVTMMSPGIGTLNYTVRISWSDIEDYQIV